MYREFKSPFLVQVELTTKCNHRCIHCYNHWREKPLGHKTLSETEVEVIINNLSNSDIPSFLITGGEPMLYPNLMLKAFELGKNKGLKCSLNSNLTIVTPEIASELKRLEVGVLTSILSFDDKLHDNITSLNGSFEKLIEGIKILQEYKVPVGVNMVVMQQNIDQVYETGKFVYDLGVKRFRATKVHPAQGTSCFDNIKLPPEKIAIIFDDLIKLKNDFGIKVDTLTTYPVCLLKNLELYGQFITKRNCSAGKTGCTIGADGQVRPCGHSDEVYGNAIEESILEIWPRLKKWRDGSLLPDECKKCKSFSECGGGCRMDCKFYGKIDSMDPYATGNDFDLIPQSKEKLQLIDPKKKLVVNPLLVFRKEKCEVVLIIKGNVVAIVTNDSAKLLVDLKAKKFTLNDVFVEYKVDENFTHIFFSNLYKKNIICSSLE